MTTYTDLATPPDGASLPPDFVQRLRQALTHSRALHLWCPERPALLAAREAALQAVQAQGLPAHCLVQGQWLPLLHTLNGWIAQSLRDAPLPSVQDCGVWLIDEAQRLSAEHLALIERVLVQFPELPLRLVLLSQSPQPPRSPATAERLAVEWLAAEPPAWLREDDAPPAGTTPVRWPWWLGGAALLALAAGGLWWAMDGAGRPTLVPSTAPAPEAAPAASAPASEASASAPQASDPLPETSLALASTLAPAASAPQAQASAASAKAVPRSSLHRWAQTLPEGSWVVLHAEFASAREAEAFKAGHALLANARVVQAAWAEGQPVRYGVLSGPFRSADRVSNYLQRLAWREQARSISREALLSL